MACFLHVGTACRHVCPSRFPSAFKTGRVGPAWTRWEGWKSLRPVDEMLTDSTRSCKNAPEPERALGRMDAGGLGRNRKTRHRPRQSLVSLPSNFLGYTLGYTKLTIGFGGKFGFEPPTAPTNQTALCTLPRCFAQRPDGPLLGNSITRLSAAGHKFGRLRLPPKGVRLASGVVSGQLNHLETAG